eukprot:298470-Amphidinium_carterae.1
MKERILDGNRPRYAEDAKGKLLNRISIIGANLGGPRGRQDLRLIVPHAVCLPHSLLVTSHQWSVLWRSTTFTLVSDQDHVLTEDGPSRWGVAAVAAKLKPTVAASRLEHLTGLRWYTFATSWLSAQLPF